MPLFPLNLKPGMARPGTVYSAKGRWYDGSLVRFFGGAKMPVGGWQELTATADVAEQQFLDTFVDSGGSTDLQSHTPTGGGPAFTWAVHTDGTTPGIGRLYTDLPGELHLWLSTSGNRVYVSDGVMASADYTVNAPVAFTAYVDRVFTFGVSARTAADGSTGYRAFLNDGPSSLITLQRVDASYTPTRTSTAAFTSTPGVAQALFLRVNGSTIEAGVDGTVLVTWTDTTYTTVGFAGIFGYRSAVSGSGDPTVTEWSVDSNAATDITLDGVPRALLGWRGNDGSQSLGIGTNTSLYAHWLGSLYDITPSGFTAGTVDADFGAGGYGDGLYGVGPYGVADPAQYTFDPPAVWHLDTFGDYLVGCCSPNDGKLYYWDRSPSSIAVVMSGAPTNCQGVVVTPERFIVALGVNSGSAAGVRRIEWSGQESLTNWTPTGAAATGTLTSTGAIPADGDTVTLGSKTYTLKTTLTGVNGQVLIGGSAANALTNLYSAINLTGTAGTDYAAATTANVSVEATAHTATTLSVSARAVGTAGNSLASTENSSTLSFTGTTLSGGIADTGAGGFTLEGKGAIVAGRRTKSETLIWTTDDVHALRYIGGTLVYATERVGGSCGLIAPGAVAQFDVNAVWMGTKNFFLYNGYTSPLPCEVADFVFTTNPNIPGSGLNAAQGGKVTATTLAQYGECWWFYPSAGSDENDRYVVWNYRENHWTVGALERTAGADAGALQYPVMAASNGKLYEHEKAFDHLDLDGTPLVPYLESGPVELGDGDRVLAVSQIVPDERTEGDTELSLYTSFYPGEAEVLHGPFTTNELTDARFTGRWVRARIDQVNGVDWRVGVLRVDGTLGGRR